MDRNYCPTNRYEKKRKKETTQETQKDAAYCSLCRKKGHGQETAGFSITFYLLFMPSLSQTHLEKEGRTVQENKF